MKLNSNRSILFAPFFSGLLLALNVCAQEDSSSTPSGEDKAFANITQLLAKTKQYGEN